VATAKAMASALRVPVVGVPSLDLVAFPVRFTPRLIVSVVDARRGEVFFAFYRHVPGGLQRVTEPRVASTEELTAELLASGEECLAVGEGARRYAGALRELTSVEVADAGLAYPSAASLVQLAHARALREEFVNAWDVEPVYLRKADAEINWSVRSGS
jgi:tRNA threonylcarbamoyladenosine biosynthesis protein TsaB